MRKFTSLFLCLLLGASQLWAQNRTLTGKVVDEKANPMAGVTVSVKGTTIRAQTSTAGTFSIVVPTGAKQLEFTYVGYGTQTVTIGAGNSYSLALAPTTSGDIGEVVVTGYQRVKKTEYVGAVAKVSSDKINFVPNASFDQILQGRAAGLLVTVGSGQPGASANVVIRGQSSINGGSAPLYILDGMVIEEGVFQSLNPNDFESVDVLKDAVSTAPYGNRGSAGVIVVTTKKGVVGKPVLTYTAQVGRTEAGEEKFNMMNSAELLQYQEILGLQAPNALPGYMYSKKNPTYATMPAATQALYDRTLDSLKGINTDWRNIFLRNGTFSSHDLTLSGGNGGTRFYIAGGYYTEDGIGLRSDLKRYTLRANLDQRSDKLTLSLSTGFGYTKRNFIESENGVALANPFAAAYLALPYQKLFKADGTVDEGAGKVGPNAYGRVFETSSLNGQLKATANLTATYNITKNIYVGGSAGLDYRQTVNERSVYPGTYAANAAAFPVGPQTPGGTAGGSYATGYNNSLEYIIRANAGFRKVFNGVHDVDVQLISEFTNDKLAAFNYTGFGLNPKLPNTPAGITPGNQTNLLIAGVGGSNAERALYGTVALAKYVYKGKYIFNGSFRRDGSSQLPTDTRFANFYSVGAAWNVLKESFASNWRKVNDLKLRVSYGTSANSDGFAQGYYGYLSLYGQGTYNGSPTVVPTNIGNDALEWEIVKQLNIGLDVTAFSNRVRATVDVYNKKSTGVIVAQTLPLTQYGVNVNAGEIVNKGIEVTLSGDVVKTRNFTWTIGGNVAYNKNEVTSLGQVNEFEQGTGIIRVGLPLGTHYLNQWGGVDAATGSALYYTKAGKLTNVISDDDRLTTFGTSNAPWIGGFNTSLNYKNFSLSAFFTFQADYMRFNNQDYFQLNHAFALQGYNVRKENLTIWQKPGDVTNLQSSLTQREFSSKDIQDASYLRFRNLTLGYDVPQSVFAKQNIVRSVRVYGQAQNLFTWTNWTGFDPEDDNNIAQYEYPLPRTFTIGLSISFK